MRIFLTGGTGFIGSALIPDLVEHGHQVLALARSDASAAALERAGAHPLRGSLEDLDGLRRYAADADGIIHLAFDTHRMLAGDFFGAVETDLAAVQALGETLIDTGKPFVGTAGTMIVAELGRTGTEDDFLPEGPRSDAENWIIDLAERGVRSCVVRIPPITHNSELDHSAFGHRMLAAAAQTGVSAYVDSGDNVLPAVNVLDAATLYRLAIEKAPAGSRLHAVAEEGVPARALAEAIGQRLGVPTKSLSEDEAAASLGFLAHLLPTNNPTSATVTRSTVDWAPTHAPVLDDLRNYPLPPGN